MAVLAKYGSCGIDYLDLAESKLQRSRQQFSIRAETNSLTRCRRSLKHNFCDTTLLGGLGPYDHTIVKVDRNGRMLVILTRQAW